MDSNYIEEKIRSNEVYWVLHSLNSLLLVSDALLPSRCSEVEGNVPLTSWQGSLCLWGWKRSKTVSWWKVYCQFFAVQFSGSYIQEVMTINSKVVVQSSSGGTKETILLNLQYHNILCSIHGICYNAIREKLAPEPCLLALCIGLSINNWNKTGNSKIWISEKKFLNAHFIPKHPNHFCHIVLNIVPNAI